MLRLLIPGYSSGDESSVVCDIDENSIRNFWDILVEEKLFGSSSHEQKYLGFSIFAQMLPCVRCVSFFSLSKCIETKNSIFELVITAVVMF